jgi:hypothetical protein
LLGTFTDPGGHPLASGPGAQAAVVNGAVYASTSAGVDILRVP